MNRILIIFTLTSTFSGVPQAAPVAADPTMIRLEDAIRRYSEDGRLAELRAARLELARHARDAGAYLTAARQYELLLASRPPRHERVRFFIELGRMRESVQDYSGAISAYEDAIHDDAKSFDARMLLGYAYAKVDLYKPAEDAFVAAHKIRAKAHEPLQGVADLYAKRGYPDKAITAYRKALDLEPRQASATLGLADCYMRLSDFANAQLVLERAASIAPSAEFNRRLAELYRRQGNPEKALAALETALKSDEKRDDILLNLAMLYAQTGRSKDSDRVFQALQKTYPASPLVRFMNAWVLYERGDRSGARHQALEARRLAPTTLVKHYNDKLLQRLELQ